MGNPASTMSQFMAESRLALGLGHNNIYMARDENCQWKKACGDRCLFRPNWGGAFDPSTSSHCKSVEVTKLSSEVVDKIEKEQILHPRQIWGHWEFKKGMDDVKKLRRVGKG